MVFRAGGCVVGSLGVGPSSLLDVGVLWVLWSMGSLIIYMAVLGRGVKEKQRVFADVSAKEHDCAIEDMTSSSNLIDDNVKVCGMDSGPVTPSVTTCLDNVGNTLGNEAGNLTSSPNGNSLTPISFATLVKGDTSRKVVNFRTLVTPADNGADVVISKESVCVVNERLNNTVYGFFLGKHVAYPVVKNYKSLSAIATKLGKPIMLDSYTVAMCTDSWGRASYARALGYTLNTVHVEYEWTPPRCSGCKVFGHILDDFPKKILGVMDYDWKPLETGGKQNSDILRINNLERQMLNGKLVLVDYDWKPLETEVNKSTSIPSSSKVASKKVMDESASDIEDIYDESAQYIGSGGANDPSLLEDEDYDTYDTYDLDGLTESQMAFAKAFDINLRGQIR
ncbi:hypothetical protein Tco_1014365 [Tanacetum coccineum]